MPARPQLRLGTRASPLARWQAEWVAARLTELGIKVELVPITTQGDVKSQPLGQIGGQGLFTKELQRALLDDQIDLAVHSLKDLPTAIVEGLALAAVPKRESTADVLVASVAARIEDLPQAARVGTGSLRRKAQLLHLRPDLRVEDIRGNVETRLKKLDDGHFEAIVLAEAGLIRLGLAGRIASIIPRAVMLPAVGQGALGIETRGADSTTRQLISPLNHEATQQAVAAERSLLLTLRGGCLAPVGAIGRIENGRLRLDAVVLSGDGAKRAFASGDARPSEAAALGQQVAQSLIDQGAAEMIASSRASERDVSPP
ncbi:MAG: hydroxymethylbilane synthase [Planctomycetaceae bacterium]|nr:hydroxymethylbilane synthase [Planctomycetaceae bacterium]